MSRPVGSLVENWTPPAAPGPDVIEGRFVTLERLDAERHAADLFAANQDQDWVWDYLGYGPFETLDAYRDWMAEAARLTDPFFYALRDKASGRIGGIASYLRIDPPNGVIEIGHIQIAPVLQRTAASSEAIMRMVEWAFGAGYRRVEWKCNALNVPSCRAAERYGFTYEGTFRQHMITKGQNRDTAWYAIIDADWPAIRTRWQGWLAPGNFDDKGQQRQPLSAF